MAPDGGRPGAARDRSRRAGTDAASVRPAGRARGLRRAAAAARLPVAALAVARRALQPDGAARPPATLRPRDDRQSVSPVAGGAAMGIARISRVDGNRLRAGALPADGRPGLLLQQLEVPLLLHLPRRR